MFVPAKMAFPQKSVPAKLTGTRILLAILLAGTPFFAGCMEDDPEDPGFHKPVAVRAATGEISTVDEYLDGVREENQNRLNREGDRWSNPEDF